MRARERALFPIFTHRRPLRLFPVRAARNERGEIIGCCYASVIDLLTATRPAMVSIEYTRQ